RLKFAETLITNSQDDLSKLGLALDTLKILHVSDDTGYLDSIGRGRIATVLRDAEVAESQANQEAQQAQAAAKQRAEVAKAESTKNILQKKNQLRTLLAQLEGQASAIEKEAAVAAQTARAQAEQELQGVRAELEKQRLQADVVAPAEAYRVAQTSIAKGDAAPTAENG